MKASSSKNWINLIERTKKSNHIKLAHYNIKQKWVGKVYWDSHAWLRDSQTKQGILSISEFYLSFYRRHSSMDVYFHNQSPKLFNLFEDRAFSQDLLLNLSEQMQWMEMLPVEHIWYIYVNY